MLKYIARRLLMLIPVLLGVILLVFSLMYITPGDPVDSLLGDNATPEAREALREELALTAAILNAFLIMLCAFCAAIWAYAIPPARTLPRA